MIITWTIATIAALIGSSLISSTSEETEQSKKTSSEPQDKKNDYKLPKIPINDIESEAYQKLIEALKNKSIKEFKDTILYIESEYYRNGILLGDESSTNIYEFINGRFQKYCEKNKIIITPQLDQLKDYIEFLFLKTNKETLEIHYIRKPLPYLTLATKNINPNEITNKLKKILDADKAIKKYGLKTYPYCYYDLLNDSGHVYRELSYLNTAIGYIPNTKTFSDLLVNEIAETIMKNTDFYFCHELTISVFAKDLKNHIINFLHHDQPICEDNLGIDAYVQILDDNYFKNRKIRNYYYFLIVCARFVEALKTNWETGKLLVDVEKDNISAFHNKTKDLLFKKVNIRKYNYTFLNTLSNDEIWQHILATKAENDDKHKRDNEI